MITMKPFDEKDLGLFTRRRYDVTLGDSGPEVILVTATGAWTYWADDVPIAICGITKMHDNAAHIWAFVSHNARHHGLGLVKACKWTLQSVARDNAFLRYQTSIDPRSLENQRFARLCGFSYESTMYQAAPNGGDLQMWTILWGGKYGRQTVDTRVHARTGRRAEPVPGLRCPA